MKKIIIIILMHVVDVSVTAQNSTDSIRAYYSRIASLHIIDDACKAAVAEYESKIAGMKMGNLQELVQQVRSADTAFLKKNLKKCTEVNDLVKRFDSWLKLQKPTDLDEIGQRQLTNAVIYLKNKFTGLLLVRLRVKDDSVASIPGAIVSIQSVSPAIIQRTAGDSSAGYEIYIQPQADYALVIREPTHEDYEKHIKLGRDTLLGVSLSRIEAPPDGITQPVKKTRWPYILAGGLLAMLSGFMFVKYRALRKTTSQQRGMLQATAGVLESKNRELAEEISRLRWRIENETKSPGPLPRSPTGNYFVSEIMLTAGPRKKSGLDAGGDTELGEDVCGLITHDDTLFTWVIDGTSDSYILRNPVDNREYFSSRLLAQSLGRKFKKIVPGSDIKEVIGAVTDQVRNDWLQQINKLPSDEKEVLKRNIKSGNAPFCSVTLLCGTLSLDGKLVIYRSGDSKMLIYTTNGKEENRVNTVLAKKNTSSNDRLFFKLGLGVDDNIDMILNTPLFEVIREQQVAAVIGYSDGIGEETQALLKSVYPKKPDMARDHMIYQMQGTLDDKAICMIEIKSHIV